MNVNVNVLARRAALFAIALGLATACKAKLVFPPIVAPGSIAVEYSGGVVPIVPPVPGASAYRMYYSVNAPPDSSASSVVVTVDEMTGAALQGVPIFLPGINPGDTVWIAIAPIFGRTEGPRTAAVAVRESGGPESFRPPFVLHGPAGSGFGGALAAGDFNGDGRVDLAVGAPTAGSGSAGLVAVFPGRIGGLDTTLSPAWEAVGSTALERFGSALAALRTSGRDDLIVGAPGFGGGDGAAQRWQFHQNGFPLLGWSATGGAAWELGSSLATGDVDSDGRDDLVAGAPGGDRVLLVLATQGSAVLSPDWSEIDAPEPPERFGGCVSVLAKGAADAAARVLVGAPGRQNGDGAFLLYAPPAPTAELANDADPGSLERLGASCTSLGDPDGDGHTDFAVGAPDEGAMKDEGMVFFWKGGPTPLAYTSQAGYGSALHYATSIAAGADIFGRDGLTDAIIGGDGDDLLVWRGDSVLVDPESWESDAAFDGGGFGDALALGDFDGDGWPDVAVGAPGRDEVDVFVNEPVLPLRVDAGGALRVAGSATTAQPEGATFSDDAPIAPHRCEWFLDASTTPSVSIDGCTPQLAAAAAIPLPPDGADHWIRLRVTDVEDGRFADAAALVTRGP